MSHKNRNNNWLIRAFSCLQPFPRRGAFPRVLGERLNGIQEVRGSIPLISTRKKHLRPAGAFVHCFTHSTVLPMFEKKTTQKENEVRKHGGTVS